MRGRALLATSVFVASCVATADAPVNFPPARFPPARRARKIVTDGPADEPSPAPRALPSGAYDLGQLPVLSKVLFYLHEDYFDKRRLDYEDMAMGALDFLQRDVPEVVVDRQSDRTLSVTVADARRTFAFADVDQPWKLRSTLQRIFQFVQANLPAAAPESEGQHLLDIETAAVNGMLYALDPHSVLLDAATYAEMAARRSEDRAGSVGVFLRVDAAGRIVVTDLPPSSPAGSAGIGVGDRITHIDGDPTQNMMLDEVVDRLLGPIGSEVLLTVEHSDRRAPQRKTVV
ncbi:MAG: PDZ domain-containing protein, partial [Pseudomonadota bacterium]